MPRHAQSYSYHETFRVFRHDTGYGVCTEQIPCLGVGSTPGYALADLQPYDLLPQTEHVETVALLRRRDGAPVSR